MKIPDVISDVAQHATVAECERLNWLDRRIATLEKWISERTTLTGERDQIVATVKARAGTKAPQTE